MLLEKLHEIQITYIKNLQNFITEFMSLAHNSDKMIVFGKEKTEMLARLFQDIEVKMQKVAYGKLDSLSNFNQDDYNQITKIVNLIENLDMKLSKEIMLIALDTIERSITELLETSGKIVGNMAEDQANNARVMKTQLVNMLDKSASAGELVEEHHSYYLVLILFGAVVIGAIVVFRKYYKAKKTHML